MAWLFGDSFDHYATADISTKWTATNSGFPTIAIIPAGGRRGSQSLRFTQPFGGSFFVNARKTLAPANNGFVCGFFFTTDAACQASGIVIVNIEDSSTVQCTIRLNADFTLSVCRAGTVLGTTGPTGLAAGVGGYIEWKGVVAPGTGGSSVVKVNNNTLLTLTGVNTSNTGTSTWNAIWLGTYNFDLSGNFVAQYLNYDDFYCLDTSGSGIYTDFLGDVSAYWHPVTGAGANTGFTPSTGANWQNVDDTAPDGDSTCNTATAPGQKDTFVLTDLIPTGAQILCVQHVMSNKKTGAGLCTIGPVIRHSGTDNVGASPGPSTAYAFQTTPYITNPGTGVAWTESGFNAIEIGYQQVT
jgi:hypothetical protein